MPEVAVKQLPDLLQRQPRLAWRRAGPAVLADCPQPLRALLSETGSLTRALREVLAGDLDIRLQQQSWHYLAGRTIQSPGRQYLLARRMGMHHQDERVMDALSLLPASLLSGHGRSLRRLGNRALGDALFSGLSRTRRGRIDVAWDPQHWWRRSQLHTHGEAIFLIERFPLAFWRRFASQQASTRTEAFKPTR